MKLVFAEQAWEDYLHWQATDRKLLKRINALIREYLKWNGYAHTLSVFTSGKACSSRMSPAVGCALTNAGAWCLVLLSHVLRGWHRPVPRRLRAHSCV